MKRVKVKVTEDHEYDGKPRKVGEEYDAEEKDLVLLTALKRVKVLKAEETAPADPHAGRYKRRDMRPKE
jgi:hypothetical protein